MNKRGSDEAKAAMMWARQHKVSKLHSSAPHDSQAKRYGKMGQKVCGDNRTFRRLGIGR